MTLNKFFPDTSTLNRGEKSPRRRNKVPFKRTVKSPLQYNINLVSTKNFNLRGAMNCYVRNKSRVCDSLFCVKNLFLQIFGLAFSGMPGERAGSSFDINIGRRQVYTVVR